MDRQRHIFLTGEIQVGKSTIINRAIKQLNIHAGGFKTVAGSFMDDGSSNVHILDYNEPLENCNENNRVARRFLENGMRSFEIFTRTFDRIGSELLKPEITSKYQLVVMDELGFMESEAFEFQKAVLNCLDGDVPVIGVIKPKQSAFLDNVRSHDKIKLIEVEKSTRDHVYDYVVELLRKVINIKNC
jgi:nucleoside-triphosphatase